MARGPILTYAQLIERKGVNAAKDRLVSNQAKYDAQIAALERLVVAAKNQKQEDRATFDVDCQSAFPPNTVAEVVGGFEPSLESLVEIITAPAPEMANA